MPFPLIGSNHLFSVSSFIVISSIFHSKISLKFIHKRLKSVMCFLSSVLIYHPQVLEGYVLDMYLNFVFNKK